MSQALWMGPDKRRKRRRILNMFRFTEKQVQERKVCTGYYKWWVTVWERNNLIQLLLGEWDGTVAAKLLYCRTNRCKWREDIIPG